MTQNQPHHQEETPEPEEAVSGAEPIEDAETTDDDAALAADETTEALAELEAELGETKDRMLRAMAETENLRRRATRDTEEAVTGFARELLEVSDNLARALESVPEEARDDDHVKPLMEGIELTQRSLAACFERQKIVKVAPEPGEKFDHNLHQAMFETETEDQAPGSIMQVMQPGYKIADRLLRPAMVGVAKKSSAPAVTADDETDASPGQRFDTSA